MSSSSYVSRNWKYLSIILMGIMATGVLAPRAFAANPTLEEVLAIVMGIDTKIDTVDANVDAIKAKTDNLPEDPASQTDTGVTKALTYQFNEQLGDGSGVFGIGLLGSTSDGKNRSGHVSLYSFSSSVFTQPEVSLGCSIINNEFSSTTNVIATMSDRVINTSFSCNALTLNVRDIGDGDDTPENIVINIQYVETDNLTIPSS